MTLTQEPCVSDMVVTPVQVVLLLRDQANRKPKLTCGLPPTHNLQFTVWELQSFTYKMKRSNLLGSDVQTWFPIWCTLFHINHSCQQSLICQDCPKFLKAILASICPRHSPAMWGQQFSVIYWINPIGNR